MQDVRLKKRGGYLGRVGETGRYRVWLDVSDWEDEYSGGTGLFLLTNPEGTVIPMSTSVVTEDDETKMYGLVTDTETAIAGVCVIEATWTSGGVLAKSDHFNGLVLEATYTGETTPDSTPTWVRDLITELNAAGIVIEQAAEVQETVEQILENIDGAEEDAEQAAEDAEAWAVGERNGSAVVSGDETWENNSKYYAGEAADSEDAAADSASDAEAFAVGTRGGADVTADDPAYHNNAKYYKDLVYADTPAGFQDLVDDVSAMAGDIANLQNQIVPMSVRQALHTLLNSAIYTQTGLDDEINIIEAWAESVTNIALNYYSISFNSLDTFALSATTTPQGGSILWASSNPGVATVSDSGLVTSVANGSCTITATCGNMSASCAVTVTGIVALHSITAQYTQGGTVYEGSDIDDLKADLVVTAVYTDTTTSVISADNYTLSGTLAAGTSTVTVTAFGKTTTFTVTVTSLYALKAGYGVVSPNNILTLESNTVRGLGLQVTGTYALAVEEDISGTVYYPMEIPAGKTGINMTSSALDVAVYESYYSGGWVRNGVSGWKALSSGTSHDYTFTGSGTTHIIMAFKDPGGGTVTQANVDAVTWSWLG